ncbi:uncharacterized protein LOC124542823 [Vanessa cardui]|uniref:uncharacterized protein LOC124542823 n=1 Tax=Vanessa cardui TaxID=171605 RepID=UPI001F145357|nr:uncharacterized protein LOC124542823 [Vanessa cardui]
MGARPSDDPSNTAPDPISELGSEQIESRTEGPWRALLDLQSRNMAQLIDAIQGPSSFSPTVHLPEFNPDLPDSNARAWSTTVDLCFSEQPLNGSSLIIALSKSLKGHASTWFSQVSYGGMTWTEFKNLFFSRYDVTETSAATLINVHSSQPKDGESLAAYANRLVTSLTSSWNGFSVEKIAVATVLAHVSKFDSRAHRLAFTTEVSSRNELQKELNVFSHLKRKSSFSSDHAESNAKRFKQTIVCHYCGVLGHKSTNCRKKLANSKTVSANTGTSSKLTSSKMTPSKTICFRCGESGHIAPRCPTTASGRPPGSSSSAGSQASSAHTSSPYPADVRRVDACEVRPVMGVLTQSELHEDV